MFLRYMSSHLEKRASVLLYSYNENCGGRGPGDGGDLVSLTFHQMECETFHRGNSHTVCILWLFL